MLSFKSNSLQKPKRFREAAKGSLSTNFLGEANSGTARLE